MSGSETTVILLRETNQALGIGQFARDFLGKGESASPLGEPADSVWQRTELFHLDAVLCGISALALNTNAPNVLRDEALHYPRDNGATVFGSSTKVVSEKAILANCSAVREWDSNGTNFGYHPELGHTAGEFGHNDFYAVAIAAAQEKRLDGRAAVRGMILLDEIRGRLAEVFSLKTYKIDHVVHGAIASAATYGAMVGATAEQIESAIGMVVAHYIPFRAIRAGKQLSDSKGSSAAISTEVAIMSVKRSMAGFIGPKDIFRNPEAIFRFFEPTEEDESPFDLVLTHSGEDFAVMGMHFKLGLYEHQSAGALQGLINLLQENPKILESPDAIKSIKIVAYEPAFGIIGDPAKRDPKTRQSADHSMVYIVSTMLRNAIELSAAVELRPIANTNDGFWKKLMLGPYDYSNDAIFNQDTRALMQKITFEHGGKEYDEKYPDGIPTSLVITLEDNSSFDSGLVMYPAGHARNTEADLHDILKTKFDLLGGLAVENPAAIIARFSNLVEKSADEIATINEFELLIRDDFE